MIYFSDTTKGFYDSKIQKKGIPSDVVEITEIEWRDLLSGQSSGLEIYKAAGDKPALRAIVISQEELALTVRTKRNAFLRQTDYTQLPDFPEDSAAWAVYRKLLRDMPEQAEFPINIVWPVEPV